MALTPNDQKTLYLLAQRRNMTPEHYLEEWISVVLMNERNRASINPRNLTEIECQCGARYVVTKGESRPCPRCRLAA